MLLRLKDALLARTASTTTTRRAVSTQPYPFNPTATIIPSSSSSSPVRPSPPLPLTDSLLRTLNAHLTSLHPLSSHYTNLFSRRSKNRLLPGSVLTVSSYTTPPTPANPSPPTNSFSGVLIAIRRRHMGRDTSIRLRNLIGRTGVEVSYKVFSPLVKEIKVVSAAKNSGVPIVDKATGLEKDRKKPALKASKRAKMYFVRDQPDRLAVVGGIVKQARERELQAAQRRTARR